MKTNEELIEILKPALDAIQNIGSCPSINDVQINVSRFSGGAYDIKVSAWAKGKRIKCGSLDTLLTDVVYYDPEAENRKEKEQQIAKLQSELAALKPKPTTAE